MGKRLTSRSSITVRGVGLAAAGAGAAAAAIAARQAAEGVKAGASAFRVKDILRREGFEA